MSDRVLNISDIDPIVACMGRTTFQPGFTSLTNSRLPDHDIQLVYKGSGFVAVDGVEYFLEKGDVITIFPGESFYVKTGGSAFGRYHIHFDFTRCKTRRTLTPFLPDGTLWPRIVHLEDDLEARGLCTDIILHTLEESTPSKIVMNGKFTAFLGLLLDQHLRASSRHTQRNLKSRRNVMLAREYIKTNYAKELTLQELADVAGLSINYFGRMFKAHVGVSPRHYIIETRLNKAKRMLLGSDKNISEIARLVGYDNVCYFSSEFKKREGITPTEFIARLIDEGE
jgi:AraC-like DNA-binding protein